MSCCGNTCQESKPGGPKLWRQKFFRIIFSLFFVLAGFWLIRPMVAYDLISRASLYETNGYLKNAIRLYKRAIFIDKNFSEAWNGLAEAYRNNGEPQTAEKIYRQTVHVNPKNLVATANLGMLAVTKKDWTEAVDYFEKVKNLGQTTPKLTGWKEKFYYKTSFQMLAGCYRRLKNFAEEKAVREEFNQYFPPKSVAINN